MPIDDPFDSIRKQFEYERLSTDPVLSKLAELFTKLPLPWPADKLLDGVVARVQSDRIRKIELLVDAIIDELRRQERKLADLMNSSGAEPSKRVETWSLLVVDGFRRARDTRAASRVERIGTILARSLLQPTSLNPDETEEFMRIAAELSDAEVRILTELADIQGPIVAMSGRITRYDAWSSWARGSWGETHSSDIDSIFGKLESFGLVASVPPQTTTNVMADVQNRYALLRKGLDFVTFVR